jgi:ABC-2 type transport system permease protein
VSAPATTPPGRLVAGPSALAGGVRRYLVLTRSMAVMDFKLRFFGSILGYLWQLMRPLMMFGVLYIVFTQVVDIGAGVPFYAVALLGGVVLYSFLAESTSGALTSVVDRESLVRKVEFPRLAVPSACVLAASFSLGLNLLVVIIFGLVSGVSITLTWLELPLVLAIVALWCFGLSTLMSALFVRFRDLRPIWDVLLQVTFYATPILYPIEKVPEAWLKTLLMCNPLAVAIVQFRRAVVDPGAPSAAEAIGGWPYMAIPAAILFGMLALGLWVFNREAPRIAEDL